MLVPGAQSIATTSHCLCCNAASTPAPVFSETSRSAESPPMTTATRLPAKRCIGAFTNPRLPTSISWHYCVIEHVDDHCIDVSRIRCIVDAEQLAARIGLEHLLDIRGRDPAAAVVTCGLRCEIDNLLCVI